MICGNNGLTYDETRFSHTTKVASIFQLFCHKVLYNSLQNLLAFLITLHVPFFEKIHSFHSCFSIISFLIASLHGSCFASLQRSILDSKHEITATHRSCQCHVAIMLFPNVYGEPFQVDRASLRALSEYTLSNVQCNVQHLPHYVHDRLDLNAFIKAGILENVMFICTYIGCTSPMYSCGLLENSTRLFCTIGKSDYEAAWA